MALRGSNRKPVNTLLRTRVLSGVRVCLRHLNEILHFVSPFHSLNLLRVCSNFFGHSYELACVYTHA